MDRDVTSFGTDEDNAERMADRVIEAIVKRLTTPVGERQVNKRGLPVIAPYEVAITFRGDTDRENRTQSVIVRFGTEVAHLLLGFRKLQILYADDGELLLHGLTHNEQDTTDRPRHAVPQKLRGRTAYVEGYKKWVALLQAHGWRSGETRIYYPMRAAQFVHLRNIEDFQDQGASPDPQMTIHV
jgi:hypothetical protein